MTDRTNLPDDLASALQAVGEAIRVGTPDAGLVRQAVAMLMRLPPDSIPSHAGRIRDAGGLWSIRSGLAPWFRPVPPDEFLQLASLPDLAWLFLFHADGHVRQAALDVIQGPISSGSGIVSLVVRLNDWVPQVREAAVRTIARCLPETGSEPLVDAALLLLGRGSTWGRWGLEEAKALEYLIDRPEVILRLAELIRQSNEGPMTGILASALRWPRIDAHLPGLARSAAQPAVRALAFRVLIAGLARWPAGLRWIWLDKPAQRGKAVTTLAERALSSTVEREPLILAAAVDRSPRVRRVAAQALVDFHWAPDLIEKLLPDLLADRDAGVRERAEFVRKRRLSAS